MLLILGNTPISKHHCLCLNPCLDIPTKLKFYVKNLVTKHDLDINCKSPLYRKIGPMPNIALVFVEKRSLSYWFLSCLQIMRQNSGVDLDGGKNMKQLVPLAG